jgi:hypothetical protein
MVGIPVIVAYLVTDHNGGPDTGLYSSQVVLISVAYIETLLAPKIIRTD